MHKYIGPIGNLFWYNALRDAVRNLDTKDTPLLPHDVAHIQKFRNLMQLSISSPTSAHADALSNATVIAQVAPSLTNLRSIRLNGPSSFEALEALSHAPINHQVTELRLDDTTHTMSAADLSLLESLQALKELSLSCKQVPAEISNAVAHASSVLNCRLKGLSLVTAIQSTPEILAALPGRLTCLTQLMLNNGTSSYDHTQQQAHEAGIIAAISPLKDLKSLELHCAVMSAGAQQQALAPLTRLTALTLLCRQGGALALVPSQDSLEVLKVEYCIVREVADAVLQLSSLRELSAVALYPSKEWRLRVAEDCGIQVLSLTTSNLADETLRNIPKLPLLRKFSTYGIMPSNNRYRSLARLLLLHSDTLQDVLTNTHSAIEENLLPGLPACEKLVLSFVQADAPAETLRSLADCKMPRLKELSLLVVTTPAAPMADPELDWIRELHALEILMTYNFPAEVREQVRAMLQGRPQVRALLR